MGQALKGKALKFTLLALAVVALFVAELAYGSVSIPIGKIISAPVNPDGDPVTWKILSLIRFPRAVTALLAGAALSMSGLQMQTLFRNPMAGPSVLGVTAGATLGVAFVMLASGYVPTALAVSHLGVSGASVLVLAASVGAGLLAFLVAGMAAKVRDQVVLLIIGMMIGQLAVALVSVWQYFSEADKVKEFILWTFGSLGGVTLEQLPIFAGFVLVAMVLSFGFAKNLNGLALGEDYARSMGFRVERNRTVIILVNGLLVGCVTAFCGPVGFVGVAVPHVARAVFGTENHRVLMPASALLGMAILLLCDRVAHWPGADGVLPINAVTSLIGAPVVIRVILKSRGRR
ncbi:iron(III) ABC transporter permease (plasmid) [Fulvitalea axinellae]|uniref:Iron(III) ABC transporter permease n=1 Tax=Fulvitalea axinellae TaxID=1182444 RepID=A0AAU9CPN9_9BACT|nr:iron(III) ABC transporter permease [Fulvitalea axinellae]